MELADYRCFFGVQFVQRVLALRSYYTNSVYRSLFKAPLSVKILFVPPFEEGLLSNYALIVVF